MKGNWAKFEGWGGREIQTLDENLHSWTRLPASATTRSPNSLPRTLLQPLIPPPSLKLPSSFHQSLFVQPLAGPLDGTRATCAVPLLAPKQNAHIALCGKLGLAWHTANPSDSAAIKSLNCAVLAIFHCHSHPWKCMWRACAS